MRALGSWPWVEVAITGYAVWAASDLLVAWRTSPLDRWGWVAWLIWSVPAFRGLLRFRRVGQPTPSVEHAWAHAGFLAGALACAVLDRTTDLNVLGHLALALAVAAWVPGNGGVRGWVWLATGIAWTPGLGWLLAGPLGAWLPWIRIGLALAGIVPGSLPAARVRLAAP